MHCSLWITLLARALLTAEGALEEDSSNQPLASTENTAAAVMLNGSRGAAVAGLGLEDISLVQDEDYSECF